ncbi:MAG: biotin--[acetyl-CoA-carboxylase] ligase [Candidatus Gastranaerophilales bacterium]|nr:biotin--[acetyl-CoA-carboxylase] ligase [Candidatus Gastranaerophilales bacterium]
MVNHKKINFKELNSTNAYVLENFDKLNMGDVVIADVQTNGRGRFDRVWESNSSDNLYMTFVIKPENSEKFPYVNLTQYLSIILNTIFNDKYGIKSDIKWPNDILYGGKKFVGILSEAKADNGKIQGVALGVGINVNTEKDFYKNLPKATSLKIITGRMTDKNELVDEITKEFFAGFENYAEKGFEAIKETYKNMCRFHSETVKIGGSFMDGEYKFAGLNDDGTFSVFDDNGEKIKVVSGDILC